MGGVTCLFKDSRKEISMSGIVSFETRPLSREDDGWCQVRAAAMEMQRHATASEIIIFPSDFKTVDLGMEISSRIVFIEYINCFHNINVIIVTKLTSVVKIDIYNCNFC